MDLETMEADSARIGHLLEWGARLLASNSASPRLDAEVLMASVVHSPRSTVMAFPERTVTLALKEEFRAQIRRRARGTPLAHLTGRKEFYSLDLQVSADTLVPRPETELLVDQVLECLTPIEAAMILDAGTGCGAVALAIKQQRPNTTVVALDSSQAALRVAVQNGGRLGLEIQWLLSNWFEALDGERFDFIVANPPYVERKDPRLTAGDLRHEPREALDGGVDGLDAIRVIVAGAADALFAGGTLMLEHGFNQAPAVAGLLEAAGFASTETHRDLAGRERVTLGTLE